MAISDFLKAGQHIYVGSASNEPTALLDLLAGEDLPQELKFTQFPLGGLNTCDFTALEPSATVTSFFMTPHLARADQSRVHFLPMQMRWVFDYLKTGVDVALLQVARDREGRLRLGPNVDFVDAVLASGTTIICQLNSAFTAPAGAPLMPESRIDYLFEEARDIPVLPEPGTDPVADKIGRLVASLVRDGDCLQTGIGAIPAAILGALNDKNDLGLHGGLIDVGGQALIQRGNVNGSQKAIDTGLHVACIGLGNAGFFAWLADTPGVVFRGADHTHEVAAMRRLDNFVSVNSAVEIDLHGQVNAEVAGGRQISGTGGSVDFMRGAKASKGGRSIVAMHATARGGEISRIVPQVGLVTALRTDVDIVVTEYGIAELKNQPLASRAEALVAIAAPQFRDELAAGLTL